MTEGRAASVHDRLLAYAKKRGEDFTLTLTKYAIERFLYRLSLSPYRDRFLLKGALLFNLWFQAPFRPTRDADFLGLIQQDAESIMRAVRAVSTLSDDDGLVFDPDSIRVDEIREQTEYGGFRVKLAARLGDTRCQIQLDIGFGDAVIPGPERVTYPTLLADMRAPTLLAYPRATVIAEKLEAIVRLALANSRMKDYFDLYMLSLEAASNSVEVSAAIAATFSRRGTPLPLDLPSGLTGAFAQDNQKQKQWTAFLSRNRLRAPPLPKVVHQIVSTYRRPLLQASGKHR